MSESVWLVMSSVDYEGSDVVAVYSSEVAANAECQRLTAALDAAREADNAALAFQLPDEKWPTWPKDVPRCDGFHVSPEWMVRD